MNQDELCLNIGSWLDVAQGWTNVDSSAYIRISQIPIIGSLILSAVHAPSIPQSIIYGDLVKGLKIEPNSCKLIFASHILEHLSLADFHVALNNLYVYLQPQGILRIIVPDLKQYINQYTQQLSEESKANQAAHSFIFGSGLGYKKTRQSLSHRFQEILSNSRHQWMWDEPSLSTALSKHGFKDIRRCKYGEWQDTRFAAVEKEKRHWNSLCLEATK